MKRISENDHFVADVNEETGTVTVTFKPECNKVEAKNFEDIQSESIEIAEIAEEQGAEKFEFNLSNVTYVSSAGLRMFSAVNTVCKSDLSYQSYKVVDLDEKISKMFELTGYASIFEIQKKDIYK